MHNISSNHLPVEAQNILSIIIPVYNEQDTVVELIQKVMALHLPCNYEKQIIVVNDASQDLSHLRIKDYLATHDAAIHYHQHERNQGKGAAIRTGLRVATGHYVVIQDADLELDPQDICTMLSHAIQMKLDVVYGSRFLNRKQEAERSMSYLANKFLTWLTGQLVSKPITDMETCYKLMRTSLISEINLVENRFGFEPEITMKLLKQKGIAFGEIPIHYIPRTRQEGKKIGWKDGVRAIYCLLKYRFSH